MDPVKYPHLTMDLVGEDGNAFAILGRLRRVLKQGHVSNEEIEVVLKDAMSGDYQHLLRVVTSTVTCDATPDQDDEA